MQPYHQRHARCCRVDVRCSISLWGALHAPAACRSQVIHNANSREGLRVTAPEGRDEASIPWSEDAAPAPNFSEPRPHFESQDLRLMLSQHGFISRRGNTGSRHHGRLGVCVKGVRARKRRKTSVQSITGWYEEDAPLTLDLQKAIDNR